MESSDMTTTNSKSEAEALIPLFQLERVLNQDQNGRRISLLGSIHEKPALVSLERAAFPTDPSVLRNFLLALTQTKNLGANDIYRWYMASHQPSRKSDEIGPPDLKINLIYPCTEQHIKKYSPQTVRMVTESPEIYASHVRPYMSHKREQGRLNWVFNILDGRTEQEDVIMREKSSNGNDGDQEGFLLLPDLNWDRETATSLHLLALVERRDLWSLRDLNKSHVTWLRHVREKIIKATVALYGEKWGIEHDMLKLYLHCSSTPLSYDSTSSPSPSLSFPLTTAIDQPTYYHLHIHVVHVMLEAGATQATGKAFGLENIISQLESMAGPEAGMADVGLTYYLGEASELWEEIFRPLKLGQLEER
jgi:m7GpppX diphosphatase